MRYLLTMICTAFLIMSCGSDNDEAGGKEPDAIAKRTVMTYIMAENNLSGNAVEDLREMKEGSRNIPGDVNLVVFVDNTDRNTPPYIAKISGGKIYKDKEYNKAGEEFYASDPQRMGEALNRMMTAYPAEEYGLILWGHASGWLMAKDTVDYHAATAESKTMHRAYGYDNGSDMGNGTHRKWINIPTLARVLESMPQRFKFILADICNFQCAEVAYELRNVTDFIIGSPAEIPGIGAPYDKIAPLLFGRSDDFYKPIVDTYFEQKDYYGNTTPLSVIKTSEMENLAAVTGDALGALAAGVDIDTENAIFYFGEKRGTTIYKTLTDINCVMKDNLPDAALYDNWKEQLDRTVVYRTWTKTWTTSYPLNFLFEDAGEHYGGMSMFFPKAEYDGMVFSYDYNNDIKLLQWYYAVGMERFYQNRE